MDPVVEPGVVPVDLGKESEVTSIEMATSGPSEIFSEGGGGADGREGSFPWSLNRDDQIKNLKENCRRALWFLETEIISHPWFETVVEKLRADPCIELDKLEIRWPAVLGKFRSLDVAVMMGDVIMVQQVLANRGTQIEVKINARSDINDLTALHLAAVGGNGEIVDALLQKGADVNAPDIWQWTPLDYACRYENFTVLEELLKKEELGRSPLHVAAKAGNIDIMKKLSVQYANALDQNGRTPLHHLVLKPFRGALGGLSDIVQCLTKDNGVDVKALDFRGFSVFYVAVLSCRTELVMALLDSCKEKIRLNEACVEDLGPPIQIAYEGGECFKDIERALMECDPVKSYMETLYRDRQVYVDAANAILVGAALIASVTFASWLQPPLNYTSYSGEAYSSSVPAPPSNLSYVDVEHNLALRAFWIFNALSFYFAIGTVVCGARSVLPSPQLFIKKSVEKLAANLLVTAVLLACSVLFVIVAFGIAGAVVLTPVVKYQWYMIGPAVVGGLVCLFSLGLLFKSMWESRPGTCEKWSVSHRDYLKGHGYE